MNASHTITSYIFDEAPEADCQIRQNIKEWIGLNYGKFTFVMQFAGI